ncbi:fimbrial protein [Siccibacter colletis]|uniref:fimbrial protein n=1 Tax=Siccibacter colletis TaxID=1505757 RepID=UPI0028BDD631|nr:fimbrial protein [Siccibacter colletis]WNN48400.1 fimbrial protein [Siccibacter colletis]
MKKILLVAAISALFSTGMACAKDYSSVVTIDGKVTTPGEGSCSVSVDKTAISLSGITDELTEQGASASNPESLRIVVLGDLDCSSRIAKHQIAVKFVGDTVASDNTVLANAVTDASAAEGVGIGFYDSAKNPAEINGAGVVVPETKYFDYGLGLVKLNGQTPTSGNVHGTLTIDIERL